MEKELKELWKRTIELEELEKMWRRSLEQEAVLITADWDENWLEFIKEFRNRNKNNR